MSFAVKINEAVKNYGDFFAVNHISLDIDNGEFFTLLGPSGCGKTTLLRMIAGFNSIDGGSICFDDKPINDIPAHRRNIGMVFQNYAVFPHMSVADNVGYGLKARDVSTEDIKLRSYQAMAMMKIEHLADRMPAQLSGGQQQRVALARAIVIEPDVLLMDEPLSNLDAKLRLDMRTNIRKIQQELGITTIYVTHDQEEALAISDRIAVLDAGKIMQVGKPHDIYASPANTFVANFIGTSNFLEGTAFEGGFDILGKIYFSKKLRNAYTGKIQISVRPEQIILTKPNPAENIVGVVERVVFLGTHYEYEVRVDEYSIIVNSYQIHETEDFTVGESVGVKLSEEHMNVYTGDGQEMIL